MELNPKIGFSDTLKQVKEQKINVEVYLSGGHCFTGKVLDISDHYVVIGHLVGKEFYDALVRIEDISGISLKAR